MSDFGLAGLHAARERIAPYVQLTPVLAARSLSDELGCQLVFKAEHLQVGGAFKIRGATNAVRSLAPEQRRAGVATHSSGNHGAALARAARLAGCTAHVVVPEGAVVSKLNAIEREGAQLTRCAPTQTARESTLQQIVAQTGATAVPPYDDDRVIAGQASVGLEALEQAEFDVLVVPLGGGGLLAGCALALQAAGRSDITVIGVEPEGAADTVRSLAAGERQPVTPDTIADGLRAFVGVRNFEIIQRHVADVLTVDDDQIRQAVSQIAVRMKQVVEPSAAVGLAAIRAHRARFAGQRVMTVLTGGNLD